MAVSIKIVRISTKAAEISMATALLIVDCLTVLKEILTWSSPRMAERNVRANTAKVVVLIPPAVPPGLPPINMSISITIYDGILNKAKFTVLNPAVRKVADWKNALTSLSYHIISLKMPFHSKSSSRNVPAKSKMAVVFNISCETTGSWRYFCIFK